MKRANDTFSSRCQVCSQEFEIESYGNGVCPKCGCSYEYEEGHRIALNADQAEILRKHAMSEQAKRAPCDDPQLWPVVMDVKDAISGIKAIRDLLTNLQPHIPQACAPGRSGFIDNYIDPCLAICAKVESMEGAESPR